MFNILYSISVPGIACSFFSLFWDFHPSTTFFFLSLFPKFDFIRRFYVPFQISLLFPFYVIIFAFNSLNINLFTSCFFLDSDVLFRLSFVFFKFYNFSLSLRMILKSSFLWQVCFPHCPHYQQRPQEERQSDYFRPTPTLLHFMYNA